MLVISNVGEHERHVTCVLGMVVWAPRFGQASNPKAPDLFSREMQHMRCKFLRAASGVGFTQIYSNVQLALSPFNGCISGSFSK